MVWTAAKQAQAQQAISPNIEAMKTQLTFDTIANMMGGQAQDAIRQAQGLNSTFGSAGDTSGGSTQSAPTPQVQAIGTPMPKNTELSDALAKLAGASSQSDAAPQASQIPGYTAPNTSPFASSQSGGNNGLLSLLLSSGALTGVSG